MKFKYYFGAFFVFIVVIGLYIYSLSGVDYTYHIPFSQKFVTLPIALWFLVPVVLFFIVVLLLEIGGMYRMWYKRNKYKNDYKMILEQIENQLLRKEVPLKQPSMNRYKALSILLNNLIFDVKEGITQKSGEARLDELIELLGDLKRGEYVNLKKFNPNDNSPFFKQNIINQIKSDPKFASEVLRKSSFGDEYKQEALRVLLANDELGEIKRFIASVKFDKELANQMLGMCYAKKLEFSNEDIANLCAEVGFVKQDYLLLAQKTKECYEPTSWLNLFEYLANKDEIAEMAYFYVLLELEMIDEAKERLGLHTPNEFLKVRAYLELKSMGKKYPLELFLLD
ncbi:hypothetical protein [Helicobacter burdigaliensis]|uniref:hypothetical protein n=1 Tax=Helicobacter burdigaliensis TaxID=2315334 RepID=UPI000EF7222D|nr:hypothetical protein [Helicobacter burdigaliensis]